MVENSIQSLVLFRGIALLLLFFIIPLQLTLQNPLMKTSSHLLISIQDIRVE